VWRRRDGRRYRRRRRRGPGHRRVRRQVAGADRRQGDRRVEQRGEARARGGGGDGEIQGRVGGGVQHALEAVDRGEAGVEHRGGERGASLADGDQQVLQPVRELADRAAADDEGGALERVDGAEQGGDTRLAGAVALERQHGRRHGVEMLGRLGSEVGHHVVVGREEPPELFAQWVRGRVRRGRWRHRAHRGSTRLQAGQLRLRHLNCAERWEDILTETNVVETDDGEIPRHGNLFDITFVHYADGGHIVRTENSRRAQRQGQQFGECLFSSFRSVVTLHNQLSI